jgi:hypothetical protein
MFFCGYRPKPTRQREAPSETGNETAEAMSARCVTAAPATAGRQAMGWRCGCSTLTAATGDVLAAAVRALLSDAPQPVPNHKPRQQKREGG